MVMAIKAGDEDFMLIMMSNNEKKEKGGVIM